VLLAGIGDKTVEVVRSLSQSLPFIVSRVHAVWSLDCLVSVVSRI
jgi:hypothetical protein